MIVAPPGSMKTELLNALTGVKGVHMVDQVTPQTFISGQIMTGPGGRSPSLLRRIGSSGVVVCPDFSTVLALKHEQRASIFADLRRIYDGELRKEFGTADDPSNHEWKGRITLAVAVTPAIDRYTAVMQTLGDRFVLIRWGRAGGVDAAVCAMNQNREDVKRELATAVKDLFQSLPEEMEPEIRRGQEIVIAALAELAVIVRTHVPRDGAGKAIINIPEPESSTRLAQELCQLARGSALLDSREAVNDEDLSLVKRVAFDCMQPVRKKVLEVFIAGTSLNGLKIPASTLQYAKEELEALGILMRGALDSLALSEVCKGLVGRAGLL
jgi:hypothetical protein